MKHIRATAALSITRFLGAFSVTVLSASSIAAPQAWSPNGTLLQSAAPRAADPAAREAGLLLKNPLSIEPNVGQAAPDVRYLAHGVGYGLFFTDQQAVLDFGEGAAAGDREQGPASRRAGNVTKPRNTVRMTMAGGSLHPRLTVESRQAGHSNYFRGSDPGLWRTGVPHFGALRYGDVYRGVDLVYYGNGRSLEYDFVVKPGADPSAIRMAFDGARSVALDQSGNLVVKVDSGELVQHKPVVYQDIAGQRRYVGGSYLLDGNQVSFVLDHYSSSETLVIDPALGYSTYLGGSQNDVASAVAVDSAGSAYVVGGTGSPDFPVANALKPKYGPAGDAFVTKFDVNGALVYSTFLGGSNIDSATTIAVDSSGDAYVGGYTRSINFPMVNPVQQTNAGNQDAFVAELDPTGGTLVYSTFLGGTGADMIQGIAVDGSGNAYVAGYTKSTDFPTINPVQATNSGGQDAFVAQINAGGGVLGYSTYLGGTLDDDATCIAVDGNGNAYVGGTTRSIDFPTLSPLQAQSGGSSDGFIAQLDSSGSLQYSTYLGGRGVESIQGIALDGNGAIYVTGMTTSPNFPTASPLQAHLAGGYDAFVSKLDGSGQFLVYSTYLGGSKNEFGGAAIAVDGNGDAYITGATASTNFPTKNPLQAVNAGYQNAYAAELDPSGSRLIFSSYLGGSNYDQATGLAIDSTGDIYVVGFTNSTDLPTAKALKSSYSGGKSDAFIAEIDPSPAVSPSPANLPFGHQTVNTASAGQTVTVTNNGSTVLNFSAMTLQGVNPQDFVVSNNLCTQPLAAGASCNFRVTFRPTATGARSANLAIHTGASSSPATVSLFGAGA
jgi:hypothetical protein